MSETDPYDLQFLVGKKVWGLIAGRGTGSIIQVYLGKRFRLERASTNENLEKDVRENSPEYNIFIQCPWRVMLGPRIVCSSSWRSLARGSSLPDGLSVIKGRAVELVELDPITLDLSITLGDGAVLAIFNDVIRESSDDCAYWITTPNSRHSADGTRMSLESR